MSTKLVIVESPNKVRSIAGYLGPDFDVEASVGHIRDLAQPSELPAAQKKGPYGKFAVDVEDGFKPYYVINPDKRKTVAQLRRALKNADELYLATDDDREGEAIAWHLKEVLKPTVPVRRMTFTEITKEAVTRALGATRDIDTDRVDAQETRRILDRLVGYEISPVLWRKVRAGLSAGRVQSVATRLVVERERERMAFVTAGYWGVEARLAAGVDGAGAAGADAADGVAGTAGADAVTGPAGADATAGAAGAAGPDEAAGTPFTARLTSLDGHRVATGRDFTDAGVLRPAAVKAAVVHLREAGARAVADAVMRSRPRVSGVEDKPYRRRPAAPFTTSTLQQEASRKLRMNPRETMRVAQGLYENGFITYMRTDSTVLSGQAVAAARAQAAELYGAEYVPAKPRVYATKTKNAQEAHEAIRPAGDHFRTPAQVAGSLTGSQFRLYELIWKRTVASQMADAVGSTATVHVEVPLTGAGSGADRSAGAQRSASAPAPGASAPAPGAGADADRSFSTADFTASGTVITFRGFLAAYEEGRDAERYESESGGREQGRDGGDARLPAMSAGEELAALGAEAAGHETTPPPRYTEASLVKALEEREIGRPSTYASIMSTIADRGYVDHRGQALVPTWLAFAVTRLLEENFAELVDYDFTASMEADLDRIAAGREDRVAWLTRFYFGDRARSTGALAADDVIAAEAEQGLKAMVENLGEIDARAINSIEIGEGITLRVGRYGPYLEDAEGKRANVPSDVAPDELTVARARELFARAADDGRELGTDPATGHTIVAKDGRYGPYVTEVLPEPAAEDGAGTPARDAQGAGSTGRTKSTGATGTTGAKRRGARKAAAPKPRTASLFKSMDLSTVTLEQALDLLSLPRVVGRDAEGVDITAHNGRYGPYLKKGTDSRSLETEEELFTVTLEQALELFAQPKRRRGQAAARGPLRELGTDPESGRPVVIKDGRFGPYFTDGVTNVTLRRGDDPATVTPERAYELLAEKRAKGPVKKRTTRKKTAKTTKTTRTSAKTAKSSAKKTTAAAEKSAKATPGRPKAAGRATKAAAEKPS